MDNIPTFDCKPGCHACCGLVPFTDREKDAAQSRFPLLSWERFDGRSWVATAALAKFTCPFLQKGGCAIYDIRPAVCQLFGAVEHPSMTCPHGCGPDRKLSDAKARAIIDAA